MQKQYACQIIIETCSKGSVCVVAFVLFCIIFFCLFLWGNILFLGDRYALKQQRFSRQNHHAVSTESEYAEIIKWDNQTASRYGSFLLKISKKKKVSWFMLGYNLIRMMMLSGQQIAVLCILFGPGGNMHVGPLIVQVELHGALRVVIRNYRLLFVFVLKLESDFHLQLYLLCDISPGMHLMIFFFNNK